MHERSNAQSLKLIANLADEYSIGGMINADGIVRREDFG